MEGALRQLGGYLKAARKLTRKDSDYARVQEDDRGRIVEMVDIMPIEEDIEEVISDQELVPETTAAEKSRLLVSGQPEPRDVQEELVNETLNALRSMKELDERIVGVRQQNQLLRKARRAMQRRHLDTSSTSPLIASP
jgi:hypothetical protein